uniref:golgin subfamily A member 6-like protein 1 n=1 Tax=Gasterosteus aculeatus aculeatus TaxID=481459 RepID=UPI001A991746|nr:golgin subfamily A member 6-like protein 1 [Gasterosteus aculeatus aculeatus]
MEAQIHPLESVISYLYKENAVLSEKVECRTMEAISTAELVQKVQLMETKEKQMMSEMNKKIDSLESVILCLKKENAVLSEKVECRAMEAMSTADLIQKVQLMETKQKQMEDKMKEQEKMLRDFEENNQCLRMRTNIKNDKVKSKERTFADSIKELEDELDEQENIHEEAIKQLTAEKKELEDRCLHEQQEQKFTDSIKDLEDKLEKQKQMFRDFDEKNQDWRMRTNIKNDKMKSKERTFADSIKEFEGELDEQENMNEEAIKQLTAEKKQLEDLCLHEHQKRRYFRFFRRTENRDEELQRMKVKMLEGQRKKAGKQG